MSNRLLYGPHSTPRAQSPIWPYALNRECDQARGLVMWLPGNLLTDQRVTDHGPFGLHGAPNSFDAAWLGVNPFGGRAFNLNSSGTSDADYIRVPASPYLTVSDGAGGDTPFSFSFWMRLRSYGLSTSFPNFGRMFRSGSRIDMSFNSSVLRYEGGTNGTHLEKFGGTVSLDVPHLVIVTHDGGLAHTGVHIYVDGREVSYSSQQNGTGTFDSNTASPLDFGESVGVSGGRSFDGLVWDLRMYNRALSAQEAGALFDPATRFDLFAPVLTPPIWPRAAEAVTMTRTASLQGVLRRQASLAAAADASLRANRTIAATLGAAVQRPDAVTAGLESALRKAQAAHADLNAALRASTIGNAQLDSALRGSQVAIAGLDANLTAEGLAQRTSALDAAVRRARQETALLNAALVAAGFGATSLDASVAIGRGQAADMDAAMETVGAFVDSELQAALLGAGGGVAALDAVIGMVIAAAASRTLAVPGRAPIRVAARDRRSVVPFGQRRH